MSIQELVLVIAVVGASVGVGRYLYRLLIGRRGSCVRAIVAVVGLGYGPAHVPDSTRGILLTALGAGAAAALVRDAVAARRRLSASITRFASARSTNIVDVPAGRRREHCCAPTMRSRSPARMT